MGILNFISYPQAEELLIMLDVSLSSLLDILPQDVAAVLHPIQHMQAKLYDEEVACIASAVIKRQHEFTAGRTCARLALRLLDQPSGPISVGQHREPLWPDCITGSISHDGGYCAAAVAHKTCISHIGIDLCTKDPLQSSLVNYIASPEEKYFIQETWPIEENIDPYKLIFSVKESIYKCLYSSVRRIFDFPDVAVFPDSRSGNVQVKLLNKQMFSGLSFLPIVKYSHIGSFLFSAAWVTCIAHVNRS
tara:strand:+ start:10947 stop:11690 length:744 start_codon:yes stop_codon:yes gene_type:complete